MEDDDILKKVDEILDKDDIKDKSKKQEAIQKMLNEQDDLHWML